MAAADTTSASAPPGSPLALLQSMETELLARRPLVDLYEAYHEGRHQLGFMTEKFRATFGHMLAAVNDNWMPLVIRARIETQLPQPNSVERFGSFLNRRFLPVRSDGGMLFDRCVHVITPVGLLCE